MIATIFLTVIIFAIVMIFLSISVIAKRKPLRGTCSAHQQRHQGSDEPCDTCCCSAGGHARRTTAPIDASDTADPSDQSGK